VQEFVYTELARAKISQNVLRKFNCGHSDFNDYLVEDAVDKSADGMGVTYVLVDKAECENGTISTIFAFATIQAMSLHYYLDEPSDTKLYSIPCVEIKYFAIPKRFQKVNAWSLDATGKYYSTIFFEWLLEELYRISTSVIGFQMIFLRANENGEALYRRKKFIDASAYIIPYEQDDALGKCTPMCLLIGDNIENIFGLESY